MDRESPRDTSGRSMEVLSDDHSEHRDLGEAIVNDRVGSEGIVFIREVGHTGQLKSFVDKLGRQLD